MKFESEVKVHRLLENEGDDDPTHYSADIKIRCAKCKEQFLFLGMDMGFHPSKPMMSFDQTEARIPILPGETVNILSQSKIEA